MLTDPVIHCHSDDGVHERHRNGATDKGARGILSFFETHKCGPLCRRMGLIPPDMKQLRAAADEEKARQCVVCLSAPRFVRFGPCKHAACCLDCANTLKANGNPCPLCRKPIQAFLEQGVSIGQQRTLL